MLLILNFEYEFIVDYEILGPNDHNCHSLCLKTYGKYPGEKIEENLSGDIFLSDTSK